jgi:pyridoxine 5-phosphate synthase
MRLTQASDLGHQSGLKINAGHGLHYANLLDLLKVPWLEELNIGHSIVSRALFVGMEQAVDEMLQLMRQSGDC